MLLIQEKMKIAIMIALSMKHFSISQEELESRFTNRTSPFIQLSVERLREIQAGSITNLEEKLVICMLIDKQKEVFSREDWLDPDAYPLNQ